MLPISKSPLKRPKYDSQIQIKEGIENINPLISSQENKENTTHTEQIHPLIEIPIVQEKSQNDNENSENENSENNDTESYNPQECDIKSESSENGTFLMFYKE